MADPRTRPYPPSNGSSASRERAFNDIFDVGRPIPTPHSQSHALPNANGSGSYNTGAGSPQPRPGYPDRRERNYHPQRQMSHPLPLQPQQNFAYQESGKRSPPLRQYSTSSATDYNLPPRSPRHAQQQYDPRMAIGQRQASSPPQQQQQQQFQKGGYSDIPHSHQRHQDYHP